MKVSLRAAFGMMFVIAYFVLPFGSLPEKVEDIAGIDALAGGHSLRFNERASPHTVGSIFYLMNGNGSVSFFDPDYLGGGFTGAYGLLICEDGDYLICLYPGDLFPVTKQEAAKYLWLCMSNNPRQRLSNFSFKPNAFWGADAKINRDKDYPSAVYVRSKINS
ncbi:MAG: hypothetical protein AB8B55_01495 [Mariniblastus sp.]